AGNSNVDFNGITAFLTQPNTALIAEPLAALYKVKPGDHITVRYGPARHSVTIAGLLRPTDDVSEQGLQDLLITDISTAQELLGMTGKLSSIDLIVPEGAAGDALLATIQAILPPGAVI